jgi:phage-related protein (TIGR01555 family)
MKIKEWLRRRLVEPTVTPRPATIAQPDMSKALAQIISGEALALSRIKPEDQKTRTFTVARHPKEATPSDTTMAMDDAGFPGMQWAAQSNYGGFLSEGQAFLGFPMLAELAQRPEFRRISEVVARDMTRKWIKLQGKGKDDKSDKISRIQDVMSRLNIQGAFQEIAEHDGLFGRSHLFIDLGSDDAVEMATSIGDGRNAASKNKVKQGTLKRVKPVEAVWCYPQGYDSTNPLSPSWYSPSTWYVMGKQIHSTRLLTFVGREVPDMLKPSYSFGGVSMTQLALPYVDNWLRTRQSVSDIVSAFSVMVLETNMTEQIGIGGDPQQLFNRIDVFTNLRDNRGVLVVDKDSEGFSNVAAPLGTLDALQAQAQEHMASVCGIPLVVLLGITPKGLNASSEGDLDVYHEWIHSSQERLFRPNLEKVIDFIQLSEFGEVDPDITFNFEPLGDMNEKELAEIRNIEAQTDAIYNEQGILDTVEIRTRIANEEDSPYHGINIDDVPLPPPEDTGEGEEGGEGVIKPDLTDKPLDEAA